jgi:hypothetical protein
MKAKYFLLGLLSSVVFPISGAYMHKFKSHYLPLVMSIPDLTSLRHRRVRSPQSRALTLRFLSSLSTVIHLGEKVSIISLPLALGL